MSENSMVRLPEVIVFAGPNGSGKSTITQMAKVGGEYINADDIKRTTLCTDLEAAVKAEELREYMIENKKDFTFERIYLYQILDECKIQESSKQYIFRIPYIDTVKLKFYMPKLTTSQAELILTRDSQKFKDILVYENDYDFL